MSQRIIRTLNSKMLQDTSAGAIYMPFRPYLVEHNVFIESHVAKNGPRDKEIEILAEEKEIPKGLTDALLATAFKSYKDAQLASDPSIEDVDFVDFISNITTYLPTSAKGKKPGFKSEDDSDKKGK